MNKGSNKFSSFLQTYFPDFLFASIAIIVVIASSLIQIKILEKSDIEWVTKFVCYFLYIFLKVVDMITFTWIIYEGCARWFTKYIKNKVSFVIDYLSLFLIINQISIAYLIYKFIHVVDREEESENIYFFVLAFVVPFGFSSLIMTPFVGIMIIFFNKFKVCCGFNKEVKGCNNNSLTIML